MSLLQNKICIGSLTSPSYQYDKGKIAIGSLQGVFTVDILGNELSIDTFTVTVRYNPDAPLAYSPVGAKVYKTSDSKIYLVRKPENAGAEYLRSLPFGTPVFWLVSGSVFSKGYLKKTERIARNLYRLTCISGIGLLDATMHVGGLYTGQTFNTVMASIVSDTFAYSVASDVGAVKVYGHLPYDTARNNLHRLLFAVGAAIMRDANGNYAVSYLSDSVTSVPSSRIAMGGRTEYAAAVDGVEITEHSFFATASDETVTLFDNTTGLYVENQLVKFNSAPVYDLATTGTLTYDSNNFNCNYAVVTGVGTLTGKRYAHTTQIIKAGAGTKNVKRVSDNRLISLANSNYVAKRVYAYFSRAKTIDAKIMLSGEKTGQYLSMLDNFGDPINAFLSRMDVLVTSVKGASCKLISGFSPGNGGNNYTHRVLFAQNGTWTVPSEITQIRVVLIGGGQGGQGGYDGEAGYGKGNGTEFYSKPNRTTQGVFYPGFQVDEYPNGNQQIPRGGNGGNPGSSARYLYFDSDVTPGEQITISVGAGGAGGSRNGGAGANGTPTTASSTSIGTKSSEQGISSAGFSDPFTGDVYAAAGTPGTKGGDGGRTDAGDTHGSNGRDGLAGSSVGTYSGGSGGSGMSGSYDIPFMGLYNILMKSSGGAGGGAAFGADGGDGETSFWRAAGYDITCRGGRGGDGANALTPSYAKYGCGGNGGHGGGAGGNGGGAYVGIDNTDTITVTCVANYGGWAGHGSAGGHGGNGCCIIFY